MIENLLPGFSSLGFRIPDDLGKFGNFFDSAWSVATPFPSASGETRLLSEDYARIWLHLGSSASSVLLESSPLPGLVGSFQNLDDPKLIQLWVYDPTTPAGQELDYLYPLCLSIPHKWHGTLPADGTQLRFAVTIIASAARCFADEEALAADPDYGHLAAASVIPTGLSPNEGDPPTSRAFVVGKVLLAVRPANQFTGSYYWSLRVRTLGGEVWIALPDEALEFDPSGHIIAAEGFASGSCPELTPAPLPEQVSERTIDPGNAESAIRQLWAGFVQTTDFDTLFYEIHRPASAIRTQKFEGIFQRGPRPNVISPPNGGSVATPQLRARYSSLHTTGQIVFAQIVMANSQLLQAGKSAPALVVIAFGDGSDEILAHARSVLARVHFDRPQTSQEAALAAAIEDEEYQFGRRRRLPAWLVGNWEAYAADLWLPSVALLHETLRMSVIVCLAEPGPHGLAVALPASIVARAMDLASTQGAPAQTSPPPSPPPLPPPPRPRFHFPK